MSADVHDRVCAENFLEVSVQRHESMMRRAVLGRQQSHWVAFVTKGRLHSDKYVAKLRAQYQNLAPVGVDRARRASPFALDIINIRTEPPVLIDVHAIS